MDDKLTLLPDLAAPPKVRQKRAPKHDFHDGQGKVFAHHHDNGGGWVADTAYVAPSVKVSRHAEVFNFAKVYNECKIEGRSRIYGRARLHDQVQVTGQSNVCDHSVITNETLISGRVIVSGHARVFGNSRLDGRVDVSGEAMLIDTTARNLGTNVYQFIGGTAILKAATVLRFSRVRGSATVIGGTIDCASVRGTAIIQNSRIETYLPDHARLAVFGSLPEHRAAAENLTEDVLLCVSGGLVLASELRASPMLVEQNCHIVRCYLYLMHGLALPEAWRNVFNNPAFFVDLHVSSWERLLDHHRTGPQTGAPHSALPAIPQTGTAPVLAAALGGQRRILRLE
jgi:hypothetical protein